MGRESAGSIENSRSRPAAAAYTTIPPTIKPSQLREERAPRGPEVAETDMTPVQLQFYFLISIGEPCDTSIHNGLRRGAKNTACECDSFISIGKKGYPFIPNSIVCLTLRFC